MDGADSVCTTIMVKPTITDVKRKAALGGEPAERAYRVKLASRKNGIGWVDSSPQTCQPNQRTQTAVTYCMHALEGQVGMQVMRLVLEAERTY